MEDPFLIEEFFYSCFVLAAAVSSEPFDFPIEVEFADRPLAEARSEGASSMAAKSINQPVSGFTSPVMNSSTR
jgi:hypothetical protein